VKKFLLHFNFSRAASVIGWQMKTDYEENGYFVLRDIFDVSELQRLRQVILQFHELKWSN
jgi:hypothetical protein